MSDRWKGKAREREFALRQKAGEFMYARGARGMTPENAKFQDDLVALLRSVDAEARREEAAEWRARIRSEHWRECHCRRNGFAGDSRSAGQEHWGDCGQAVRERLLAGFAEPEEKRG